MTKDDGAEPESTYTSRTLSGVRWTYLQSIVSSVLQLVVAGVLARLLDPAAFGLVALANLSLRLVNYLARGGITQAVVQKPDLRDEDVRAGFTASVVLGLVFFGVVLLAAPVVSGLLSTPELTPVLRWMGLQLVLFSLGATADGLLRRELLFRSVAIRSVVSYVVGYAGVGLALAAAGAGIWALVAAVLCQTGLWSLLTFIARPHPVRPTLDRDAHRAVLAFGSRVSLISLLEFLGTELDTLAVGRYLGAGPVGLYNRAYLLVKLPLQQATTSLSSVLFPAFAALQSDLPRVRRGYLGALRLTSALTLPVAAGMAVAREELVLTVLGADWLDGVVVVPWIALSAALNVITHLAAVVAEAKARLNPKIVISTVKLAALVGMLFVAAGRSLVWFALALAVADLVSHIAYTWLIRRVLELRVRTILAHYLPSVVAAGAVAVAILAVQAPMVDAGLGAPLRLLVEIVVAGLVLVALLRWGPLRSAREEAMERLAISGVARDGTSAGRLLYAVLGRPRTANAVRDER